MMQLEPSAYHRLRRLPSPPHIALAIDAIVAGNSPAIAWVDDAGQPRAAYLWDKAHCHFFLGDPSQAAFRQAVSDLVREEIAPLAEASGKTFAKVYTASVAWDARIGAIFAPTGLVQRPRVFMAWERPARPSWRADVPAGLVLRQIDAALLASDDVQGIGILRDEIQTGWHSREEFLGAGFGFCLLRDDEIITWCTTEYLSPGKCGIGIETAVEHMRQGYATLTASAFVEHALDLGIAPHWDSWKANLPSVAVAHKVGFRLVTEYEVFTGRFAQYPG